MACSCKGGSSSGKQVVAGKQVVKKKPISSTTGPRKNVKRRIVYKRPI